ncbi:hypothetical protein L6452_19962 [Arctium lappa]|uniref:Uncharacterized protein n=1 Tax=Arctium lappa TaxID=4217 RepID=A0ACB9B9I7_ARCLA|nr:hypothetical protein L6452_19962 [Arctium lappa]
MENLKAKKPKARDREQNDEKYWPLMPLLPSYGYGREHPGHGPTVLGIAMVAMVEELRKWQDRVSVAFFLFMAIMAPVFSWNAWRCVWYMIQNNLVHGWGLDFALRRCLEDEKYWPLMPLLPSYGYGREHPGHGPTVLGIAMVAMVEELRKWQDRVSVAFFLLKLNLKTIWLFC